MNSNNVRTIRLSSMGGVLMIGTVNMVTDRVDCINVYLPNGRQIIFREVEATDLSLVGLHITARGRRFHAVFIDGVGRITSDDEKKLINALGGFVRAVTRHVPAS